LSNCSANNGSPYFHHFANKRVIDSRLLAGITLIAASPTSTRTVRKPSAKICPSFQLILVKTQLRGTPPQNFHRRRAGQHNSNPETFSRSNKSPSASENCGIGHAFLAAISESARKLQRECKQLCEFLYIRRLGLKSIWRRGENTLICTAEQL
jgi:hypothetical protein